MVGQLTLGISIEESDQDAKRSECEPSDNRLR